MALDNLTMGDVSLEPATADLPPPDFTALLAGVLSALATFLLLVLLL